MDLEFQVFFELFRGSVKLGTYHRTHHSKHDGWAKLWWLKLVGVFTSCFFLFLALWPSSCFSCLAIVNTICLHVLPIGHFSTCFNLYLFGKRHASSKPISFFSFMSPSKQKWGCCDETSYPPSLLKCTLSKTFFEYQT